jgi:galactokinase
MFRMESKRQQLERENQRLQQQLSEAKLLLQSKVLTLETFGRTLADCHRDLSESCNALCRLDTCGDLSRPEDTTTSQRRLALYMVNLLSQ